MNSGDCDERPTASFSIHSDCLSLTDIQDVPKTTPNENSVQKVMAVCYEDSSLPLPLCLRCPCPFLHVDDRHRARAGSPRARLRLLLLV